MFGSGLHKSRCGFPEVVFQPEQIISHSSEEHHDSSSPHELCVSPCLPSRCLRPLVFRRLDEAYVAPGQPWGRTASDGASRSPRGVQDPLLGASSAPNPPRQPMATSAWVTLGWEPATAWCSCTSWSWGAVKHVLGLTSSGWREERARPSGGRSVGGCAELSELPQHG